ncbi:STE family protein kinase [Trichomonas vaginalis G3]|uniref:STE family protein kinase n=1 Tax=Trichomonas vaginalis (strain ATCC PRA-98 / G3) TaxID=412133 RepID=A2DVI9_TRIV3|nr:stress-activated protein kinase signaling cascade [Trichomonas vaginalis G3]EAY15531.1 STE family protein kinase [Trichomonas vaginalis G3]KAI5526177.1 stress-activated protein kinase signaling cascade [Trichomonas vaginalis G3]|eukprot:XP_001327754.1 STE family protein kinase [Trichomonas vaginalis G3]
MDFPLDKQNYELLHKIGETKTGTYWVARCNLNGKLVCIKLINLDLFPVTIDELRKGVSFWATSTNNNLIQYYGAFITDSTLWFLSEYMDGGSIGNIMSFAYQQGFKDEVLLASIFEQVLLFLDYWHENHQIHRDIRPDTILISNDGDVKVGSLGCATCLIQNGQRKRARFTRIGTVSYTAPEAFLENGYTEKADIWSLGISAIELATGKNPYSSYEQMSIPMHVMSDNPPELKPQSGFSTKFLNFIKDCLQTNPSKRCSAKELLKSSFIKMSKGKKYIAATLMSNMPPVYKRYEMLHPTEPATESEVPAWAKIASNFKFQVSSMKQKSKSLSEIQNKSESNSSDDSPSSPSDTLNNPVRKGRFMVTYSRKGSRKCIPKFSLSRSVSEEFENRKSSDIDAPEI